MLMPFAFLLRRRRATTEQLLEMLRMRDDRRTTVTLAGQMLATAFLVGEMVATRSLIAPTLTSTVVFFLSTCIAGGRLGFPGYTPTSMRVRVSDSRGVSASMQACWPRPSCLVAWWPLSSWMHTFTNCAPSGRGSRTPL